MNYRSILIYVSDAADLERRVKLAAHLASHARTTVIGLAITGISRFMSRLLSLSGETIVEDVPASAHLPEQYGQREKLRLEMTEALERFTLLARANGIATIQQLQVDDDAASALSHYGNAADLIILGKSELRCIARREESDFVEFVALNAAAPVFVINEKPFLWRHALIAWNNSSVASRAARNAIPIIQDVDVVSAVIFGDGTAPGSHGPAVEEDIQQCLTALAKPINIIRRPPTADVGHALLALADELNVDLIVMGCVAHPRWRSTLLGGTTGVVIAESQVSLLLSR
ncbi:universal stress protein [Herbaspirillum rhizosphaerae]|uniref:Universal stress protein n=1 Tax=Herbaspirillum rhizosphaerae TaxID=346179 RepID=A0ABW8ZA12_9BURK